MESPLLRLLILSLSINFRFIYPSGLRGKEFLKSANQKQESPVVAMFANGSGRISNIYRGPSTDASYQVSVHLAKRFQRRFFFKSTNQKQRIRTK
jgi:hypothetical protein